MDLTAASALCRFARDGAALLLWGSSLFLLLSPQPLQASLAHFYGWLRTAAVLVLAAAVTALLPVQAASVGDGWSDAFDPGTMQALLFGTTIGTAWIAETAVGVALLFVPLLPGPWQLRATSALCALAFASLTLTGHAAMHEGWTGVVHRSSTVLHLMAAGFWLGALAPLLPTLALLRDTDRHTTAIVALRRFSTIGHAAVALVVATGILNAWMILGRFPGDWTTYESLLIAKIAVVVLMTSLAIVNRYVFVPRLHGKPARAVRLIRDATLVEIGLGLSAVALVAVFGLFDPG